MALFLEIESPDLPDFFHQMKGLLDKGYYPRSRTDIPKFYQITISGGGAQAGEIVKITLNGQDYTRVYADDYGEFSFTLFPTLGENTLQAEGLSSGEKSSYLSFHTYHLLTFLWLWAKEFTQVYEYLGQAKQDRYIFSAYGDTVQPLFKTGVDTYTSSHTSLVDKMPIRAAFPSAVTPEEATWGIIRWARKAPTLYSLMALSEGFGLADWGFFSYGYHSIESLGDSFYNRYTLNVGGGLHVPECMIRAGYDYIYVPATTVSLGAYANKWVWVYIVPGRRGGQPSWVVSDSQILPGIRQTTYTIDEADLSQDNEDGDATGIPGAHYFTLPSPAMGSIVSSTVNVTSITNAILVVNHYPCGGPVNITYYTKFDPFLVGIVHVGSDGKIDRFERPPENQHVVSSRDYNYQHEIYLKFSGTPTDEEVFLLKEMRKKGFLTGWGLIFLNSADEQADLTPGDPLTWGGLYKGYKELSLW